jgi:hypothetical protein
MANQKIKKYCVCEEDFNPEPKIVKSGLTLEQAIQLEKELNEIEEVKNSLQDKEFDFFISESSDKNKLCAVYYLESIEQFFIPSEMIIFKIDEDSRLVSKYNVKNVLEFVSKYNVKNVLELPDNWFGQLSDDDFGTVATAINQNC